MGMSVESVRQKVLITGGEGGLGRMLTGVLEAAGMEVSAPGRTELDVTVLESVKEAISQVGEVDLLIANAGLTIDGALLKMQEADWDEVMAVNLRGAFLCAREASRGMVKRRSGHILFISSFSALQPPAGQANYTAAKAALLGMMKSMALELGPRNVRVNAILPGFMETKMTADLSPEVRANVLKRHTLGRFNTPETVADFVTCIHHQMAHTSGQVFNLDSRISP